MDLISHYILINIDQYNIFNISFSYLSFHPFIHSQITKNFLLLYIKSNELKEYAFLAKNLAEEISQRHWINNGTKHVSIAKGRIARLPSQTDNSMLSTIYLIALIVQKNYKRNKIKKIFSLNSIFIYFLNKIIQSFF